MTDEQPPPWAVIGMDLGKRTDHSALALLVPDTRPGTTARWLVPDVARLPLASGDGHGHYTRQAQHLAAVVGDLLTTLPGPITVLYDSTGIGEAVGEMIADALPRDRRVRLVSVVITGGRSATPRGQRWTLSKTSLVDPLAAALEQGEVQFGPFEDRATVHRELVAYRVKPSSVEAGPDRLEAERQSDHDDTVIAVALCVYAARYGDRNRITVQAPGARGLPRARPGTFAAQYARRLGSQGPTSARRRW